MYVVTRIENTRADQTKTHALPEFFVLANNSRQNGRHLRLLVFIVVSDLARLAADVIKDVTMEMKRVPVTITDS